MSNRPKHSWKTSKDQKDRVILCLLKRGYERRFISPIFSHIFQKTLASEGLFQGLDIDALDAQFQNIKRGGPGFEVYAAIEQASQQQIEQKYQQELKEIKAAIQDLRLAVSFRSSALRKPAISQVPRKRTVRNRATSAAVIAMPGGQTFRYRSSSPRDQRKKLQGLDRCHDIEHVDHSDSPMPAILRTNIDYNGQFGAHHPVLLFRACQSIDNFHSRKFKRDGRNPQPPHTFHPQDFRDIVWPHLQRDKAYLSPFISLAQNPRNAIRRVETTVSEEMDKKMFLAIFSFNDVQEDSEKTFGKNSGPYLVRKLFHRGEVSDLPDGYQGSGEWLAYGSINSRPIAVFDSGHVVKLARALRNYKAGEAAALLRVSECLREIPEHWRENVAFNLFSHYCGRSRLPRVGTRPYRLFMEVIQSGTPDRLGALLRCWRCSMDRGRADWRSIKASL